MTMVEVLDFGVCRLSVVPVWESVDASRQATQLMFGEHYRVIGRADQNWLRIQMAFDANEGWIHEHHHHSITQEYFEQIEASHFKIATDVVSTLLYKKNPISIVMGSIVPISASELFKMDEQFAFNGEAKPLAQKRDKEFLRIIAMRYLHAAEIPGGKNPFGICAQGFVQMVYKICGYQLAWDFTRMAQAGKPVDLELGFEDGDLAFFHEIKTGHPHAGIVLTDGRVIHCWGHVRIDQIQDNRILNSDTGALTHAISQIRRLL